MSTQIKIADIIRDVRVNLDMNQNDAQLEDFGNTETLEINEIIESKIIDGVRLVFQNAPVEMFDEFGVRIMTNDITWESGRITYVGGSVDVKDLLRLVVFKMSDWDYAVTEPTDRSDERYKMQKSQFGGVRGNPQDPVVLLVSTNEGTVLEFYSCKDKRATVESGRYIKMPTIYSAIVAQGAPKVIDIPETLYRSCIYQIARLVEVTLAENEKAKAMDSVSDEFMASEDDAPAVVAE